VEGDVFMAVLGLILWLVSIVVTIAVIVAIFQIRTSTQKTADRLEDIYRLLEEQKNRKAD
jgi:uncharacterized membrane protein